LSLEKGGKKGGEKKQAKSTDKRVKMGKKRDKLVNRDELDSCGEEGTEKKKERGRTGGRKC